MISPNLEKSGTSNPSLVFVISIDVSLTVIQLLQFPLLVLLVKVPLGISMTSVERPFKPLRTPLLQHLYFTIGFPTVKSRSGLHLRSISDTSDNPYSFTPIPFRLLIFLPILLSSYLLCSVSIHPCFPLSVQPFLLPCDR